MITIDGQKYVKIKDKLVKIVGFDKQGKPVLETWSEEITHPDGRKDCTIHVGYLQIVGKTNK